MNIRCSICGCYEYTKRGNTSNLWLFECSNGHRWTIQGFKIAYPFPWRENDPYHPKNYGWDKDGKYRRLDDPNANWPGKELTKEQVFKRLAWNELKKRRLGK